MVADRASRCGVSTFHKCQTSAQTGFCTDRTHQNRDLCRRLSFRPLPMAVNSRRLFDVCRNFEFNDLLAQAPQFMKTIRKISRSEPLRFLLRPPSKLRSHHRKLPSQNVCPGPWGIAR
jgi:hypothetical protein